MAQNDLANVLADVGRLIATREPLQGNSTLRAEILDAALDLRALLENVPAAVVAKLRAD